MLVLAALAVAGASLILVTARGSAISGRRSDAPAAGQPAIVIPPVYDLGQVSQAAGVVTIETVVANEGAGDLVIDEMETSCGCTRAALVMEGTTGPWFGMRGHGVWPVGWSARLRPGTRATLRMQYDPNAHGIYRGPVDRVVLVHSNNPRRARAQIRLTGTQVP